MANHRVEIRPEQYLALWCEEHQKFHVMIYDYLISLVPAKSHSEREY